MKRATKTHKRYRRKRQTYRRKKGGSREDLREIMMDLIRDDNVYRMGKNKPVATPWNMSYSNSKLIRLWTGLTPDENEKISDSFVKRYNFNFRTYISPLNETIVNPVIYYIPEYLTKLAEAADTTSETILQSIASGTKKSQHEIDIMNIAFNDEDLYGRELTNTGKLLKEKYLSLLNSA